MNEWVQVDPRDVNKETKQIVQGVSVKVSLSPYDVPIKVRGYEEKETRLFIIEFQYPLTGEPTRQEKSADNSPYELEIGKNSRRIYKIKLDVTKLGCEAVRLEIEPIARDVVGAIKAFSSRIPDRLRDRYKLTERVVFNNRDRLLSPLQSKCAFS